MILVALYLIIGFIVLFLVARKPKYFWFILLISTIGTAGLVISGYALIDEFFLSIIVFVGLFLILMRKITLKNVWRDKLHALHFFVFIITMIYLVMESIRGMEILEDVRMIRWIIFFILVGLLAFILAHKSFPVPDTRRIPFIILWSTIIYFFLYLGHGIISETLRGISRFTPQGQEWSGSAYATFPIIFAIPSIIFYLKDGHRFYRITAWLAFILIVITSLYYDSRISWLIIIGFSILSIFKIGVRRVIIGFLLFFIILQMFIFSSGKIASSVGKFVERRVINITSIFDEKINKQTGDPDRLALFKGSITAVKDDMTRFFFGSGFYTHRVLIAKYLGPIYQRYGLNPDISSKKIVRTTGLPALLIDTGIIGIILLLINFALVLLKIITTKSSYKKIMLAVPVILFLWLFVSNVTDIVLLYFAIMPEGLIIQLNKY